MYVVEHLIAAAWPTLLSTSISLRLCAKLPRPLENKLLQWLLGLRGGCVAFPGEWPCALWLTAAEDVQEGRAQPWWCSAPLGRAAGDRGATGKG